MTIVLTSLSASRGTCWTLCRVALVKARSGEKILKESFCVVYMEFSHSTHIDFSYDYCTLSPLSTVLTNPPTAPPAMLPTIAPNVPTTPPMPLPMLETMGDALPLPLGICQGDCDTGNYSDLLLMPVMNAFLQANQIYGMCA